MKKFKPMDKTEAKNRETKTGNEILNHNLFPKLPAVEKYQHRYGEEDFPSPSPSPVDKTSQETQVKIPLAFCLNCNAERQMKWKVREKRGKSVDEWFVCAKCGYDKLEIKRLNMKGK